MFLEYMYDTCFTPQVAQWQQMEIELVPEPVRIQESELVEWAEDSGVTSADAVCKMYKEMLLDNIAYYGGLEFGIEPERFGFALDSALVGINEQTGEMFAADLPDEMGFLDSILTVDGEMVYNLEDLRDLAGGEFAPLLRESLENEPLLQEPVEDEPLLREW